MPARRRKKATRTPVGRPAHYTRDMLVRLAQESLGRLKLAPQIQAVVVVVDGTVGDFVGVASTADPAYTQQMLACAAGAADRRERERVVIVVDGETRGGL